MENKKAFTLIEMLVVIAMIGLLSTVLLVALGPSRNKAKDSRVISDVKQLVALGQSFYDPLNSVYKIGDFSKADEYSKAVTDITNQGGTVTLSPSTSIGAATSFAISATLPSGGVFCADSDGNVSSSTASDGKCK